MKPCISCGATNRYLSGRCIPCNKLKNKAWHAGNSDKVKERNRKRKIDPELRRQQQRRSRLTNKEQHLCRQRQWRESNPDKVQNARLKNKFGITLSDYNETLKSQGGVCAVCSNQCSAGRSLAVDHNHDTGQTRGLLCSTCNRGLGYFKDRVELLRAAIIYLEKHVV